MLGVPTPLTDSIIGIANVINETDYWAVPYARTAESLGIAGMTEKDLAAFLYEGSY
jgi:hypothetical protein